MNLFDFSEKYTSVVGECFNLLNNNPGVIDDGCELEEIEYVVPVSEQSVIYVSAKLREKFVTENSSGIRSFTIMFAIPFYAFTDKDKWLKDIEQTKQILEGISMENIPEWLSSIPEENV